MRRVRSARFGYAAVRVPNCARARGNSRGPGGRVRREWTRSAYNPSAFRRASAP